MRGEIKEKIEAKRQEIRADSERLRREATQNHICANCGSTLPSGKRTYCSDFWIMCTFVSDAPIFTMDISSSNSSG